MSTMRSPTLELGSRSGFFSQEKNVLICNGLAQHLRPLLPAVDFLLVASDGNLRMSCEPGSQLLDVGQVRSGIAQEDTRHLKEASYVRKRRVPYRKEEYRSRQQGHV